MPTVTFSRDETVTIATNRTLVKVFISLLFSLYSTAAFGQSVDQRVIDAIKRGFDFRTSIPVILRASEQGAVYLENVGLQTYYEDSDWTDRFNLNVTTPEGWGVFTVRDIGDGWLEVQRQEHVIMLHFEPGGELLNLRYNNYEDGARPEKFSVDGLTYTITKDGFAITRIPSDTLRLRWKYIDYQLPPESTTGENGEWSQRFVSLVSLDSVGDLSLQFTAGSFVSVDELQSYDRFSVQMLGDALRIVAEPNVSVEIFDLVGKRVHSIAGGDVMISRRALPKGLLFVRAGPRVIRVLN